MKFVGAHHKLREKASTLALEATNIKLIETGAQK